MAIDQKSACNVRAVLYLQESVAMLRKACNETIGMHGHLTDDSRDIEDLINDVGRIATSRAARAKETK